MNVDLVNCHKINICHSNQRKDAATGWNPITVARSSMYGNGNAGHAGEKHNHPKHRQDYLPGAGAVPNPRGAGQGGLDANCGFVCDPPGSCVDTCGGMCSGDPHMQLWNGEFYDYHGQCDLVFVDAPDFNNGMGLTIQLRTTARYDYSFVESAAVRIGEDVLEVSSWGFYQLNGVASAHMPKLMGDASYLVEYEQVDDKKHVFTIALEESYGELITITTFKDWVNVDVENASPGNFGTSVGLMGQYMTGLRYGRDGQTIIEDDNEFGQEWQVSDSEAMLFVAERSPQAAKGEKCVLPHPSAEQRRLAEVSIDREAAEEACSHRVDDKHKDMCIFDVMASGDLEMAHAGTW